MRLGSQGSRLLPPVGEARGVACHLEHKPGGLPTTTVGKPRVNGHANLFEPEAGYPPQPRGATVVLGIYP